MHTGSGPHPRPRRTKIVATIGPASRSPDRLRTLIEAGVDLVRLNFSHGTHAEHLDVIHATRRLSRELGRPVAILQDLQGPRLRIGEVAGGQAELRPGQPFTLTTRQVQGTAGIASITHRNLPRDVRPGDTVLIDDGRLRLRVEHIRGAAIHCVVETGGLLRSHKGVNIPGAGLRIPALTDKDCDDLAFGAEHGVDYVALSFVGSPGDAKVVRAELARHGFRAPVIAKIERAEAVDALDEILEAFDGVMIARGDLGVEMGPECVPLIQKRIIQRANALLKPVITATQMLESMVQSPTPTRAEASDVANAILDGTDAVMLSAETSIGAHPVEAVSMMQRIAAEADAVELAFEPPLSGIEDPARSVVHAADRLASEVGAKAIAVVTSSGRTAMLTAKFRPGVPVFAFTRNADVCRRLALWWGVTPVQMPIDMRTTEMIAHVEEVLAGAGVVRAQDRVVFVGSTPLTARGRTNFIKVHTVGRPSRRAPASQQNGLSGTWGV